ncbi:pyridoxamine 5'-phosphate oxidase family protein [Alkalihalobacillus sp. NPDC078783]
MNQEELKGKIEKIMDEHYTGTLATVVRDQPLTRYMTFFHEGLTLYTPTSIDTHKTDEIEANPNVHVLLGYEGEGFGDTFIEFEGKAKIKEDKETKHELWNEHLKKYFEGPDDPKLVFLELTPTNIRLMNKSGEPPLSLDL